MTHSSTRCPSALMLRHGRWARGLSQHDVALRLGLDVAAVRHLEGGREGTGLLAEWALVELTRGQGGASRTDAARKSANLHR